MRKLKEGNICIDVEEEIEEQHLLNEEERLNLASENELAIEPQVSVKFDNKQPFVLYNHKLYLQRYFHYESMILERIYSFMNEEKELSDKRSEYLLENKDFIKKLFKQNQISTDWQLIAALSAVLNNFTVITGGPGTGKTTTVSKILALLFTNAYSVIF